MGFLISLGGKKPANFIDYQTRVSIRQVLVNRQRQNLLGLPFAHREIATLVTQVLCGLLQMDRNRVMNFGFDSMAMEKFFQIVSSITLNNKQMIGMKILGQLLRTLNDCGQTFSIEVGNFS